METYFLMLNSSKTHKQKNLFHISYWRFKWRETIIVVKLWNIFYDTLNGN